MGAKKALQKRFDAKPLSVSLINMNKGADSRFFEEKRKCVDEAHAIFFRMIALKTIVGENETIKVQKRIIDKCVQNGHVIRCDVCLCVDVAPFEKHRRCHGCNTVCCNAQFKKCNDCIKYYCKDCMIDCVVCGKEGTCKVCYAKIESCERCNQKQCFGCATHYMKFDDNQPRVLKMCCSKKQIK